ncbi:Rne/Rng family ribonuclease [Microcella daejeonensis]|uniref:Ribonuclease E n=1 Tax=Microcella daejeonensis TaxID=2994971 RepID=A0A9E8MMB6_9MICO|nr:Rne/Rng family ribonuclease [Microcella daejeonensis]WAB81617.1 Rne/Rng family ribonuclease [Microcella daejeonensis]
MVKDDTEKGPIKRTRIFKGRSRRKADAPAAVAEPGAGEHEPAETPASPVMDAPAEHPVTASAPAEPVAESAPEQPAAQQPAAPQSEPAAEQPAAEPAAAQPAEPEPAAEQPAEQPAPEQPAASPFPTLKPESTTSLLFYAPPVEYLAPLPGSGPARSFDDRGDDDDAEAEEGVGTSRRRSRSRRTRGGAAEGENREGRDERAERAERISERRQPREPRERRAPEPITEPQRIKGSTRLEAKKQRRRDGRDAGRRRPVVTEAEFLARRESVDREMVVRSKDGRIQIGVLEDSVLVEHYVARSSESSLIGNVYLGRVQNVLPSMEAAFVDIGRGRNAVLYSGEVDWDAAQAEGEKNQPRRIELALKPGDRVLVQVTKDPIGHKGARLTSQVSLPGRYLVYVPNGSMSGISRKLPDTERARLKKILKEVLPENVGVIVRTAAEGATEEQLTLDVNRLTSQWAEISRQVENHNSNQPALLHSEPDLLVKIVRDVFNEDFRSMVIHGTDAQQTIESYLRGVAPDLLDRVQKYEGDHDPFDEYRISEQIEKALERKVWLPSGGSLVIDRTEAMTVVDVNTGKFVGSGGNLEETVTKNNLEAAEEIVRQLRLRDIGGIIVVDFIDMVLESNRDLVLRRLVECLSRDRTKHQVAEVTSLGLVQMTRKRLGLGLLETFSENCDVCAGRGVIVHHDPVAKHRGADSGNGNGSSRGGRGGRGGERSGSAGGAQRGQSGGRSTPSTHTGTHAITEDVSKALASIAAKTVHHDHPAATPAAEQPAPAAAPVEQPAPAATTGSSAEAATERGDAPAEPAASSEQPRSSRGGRRGSRRSQAGTTRADAPAGSATAPTPERSEAAPATTAGPADADVAILDIPVPPVARSRQKLDPVDAEQLLGSVLEALPEPPAPGTRKRASRRVSSGTISTAGSEQQG